MDKPHQMTDKKILEGWAKTPYADYPIDDMKCIKDSFKSSIWKVTFKSERHKPVILKIFKSLRRERKNNTVEKRIYRRAKKVLHQFIPDLHHTQKKVLDRDMWVIMEYVTPLQGQIKFTPDYFDKIIPTLARLHGTTFNEKFYSQRDIFKDWLPQYNHQEMKNERLKIKRKTESILETAMKRNDLYKLIRPHYRKLNKVIKKGPHHFPALLEAGQSITHNDLQLPNICCNNIHEKHWDIKFIDWEGAKFAPCWFDMINLVGVFLGYRSDWRKREASIVKHCVECYVAEMEKYGITFKGDPMSLYKMAYLQRILEKGLYLQLSWEITGRKKAYLLEGYLDKFNLWGKECGLF